VATDNQGASSEGGVLVFTTAATLDNLPQASQNISFDGATNAITDNAEIDTATLDLPSIGDSTKAQMTSGNVDGP
jgi:hypothetical protein